MTRINPKQNTERTSNMIECIVQNAADAKEAEELGATRLELVSAIELGGLDTFLWNGPPRNEQRRNTCSSND